MCPLSYKLWEVGWGGGAVARVQGFCPRRSLSRAFTLRACKAGLVLGEKPVPAKVAQPLSPGVRPEQGR